MIDGSSAAFRSRKGWADKAIAQLSDEKFFVPLDANTIVVIMKHVAENLLSQCSDNRWQQPESLHQMSSCSLRSHTVANRAGFEHYRKHQMQPITFACKKTLPLAPEEIANQVLDLAKWPDFHGYGPIPGIKTAEFEIRTASIVGSRIRVMNLDESTHVEEIVEWQPDQRIQLHMQDFSPPLSRLATGFIEAWEFQRVGSETKISRSFEMNAKSIAAWPVLWLISIILKRAIARHLNEIGQTPKAAKEQ